MPGSSTTPGRPGARTHAPVRVAFRFRNGVSTRDMNLCEAQWLAYVLPYRRFAAALTGSRARLRADVDRYSVIVSDLHRLLVAGLPAHCERFCTLSLIAVVTPCSLINGNQLCDLPKNHSGPTARWRTHMFDLLCWSHGIEHRLTKPNHPWTNGQSSG